MLSGNSCRVGRYSFGALFDFRVGRTTSLGATPFAVVNTEICCFVPVARVEPSWLVALQVMHMARILTEAVGSIKICVRATWLILLSLHRLWANLASTPIKCVLLRTHCNNMFALGVYSSDISSLGQLSGRALFLLGASTQCPLSNENARSICICSFHEGCTPIDLVQQMPATYAMAYTNDTHRWSRERACTPDLIESGRV